MRKQDVYSEDVRQGGGVPMNQHAFAPRAAAVAMATAILLAGGAATGASAAVSATPAPVSPQVTTTTTAQQDTPTAPGAPTGLTATPGNGTATLSWSAPSSDGGSPVDAYLIAGGPSPSGTGIQEAVGGQTATLSGLTNGTVYSFSVHAQNAFGDGPAVTVTVTPTPGSAAGAGSVPGAPAGLAPSSGDGFIALSWSPPASAGGSAVTGYHVYLGFSSSLVGAREFSTSGTSFRLSDAQNGSQYYIKVTALNAAGEGPGTPVTSVIPGPRVVPAQPAPSRPAGVTARARRGEVVLSWSPPPGGLKSGDGYLIYMGTSPGGEGANPSVRYLIENTTSYTIAPLTDGIRYYFQVALLDGNNRLSARSAEVSAVPGVGAGAAAGPPPGVGPGGKAGIGKAGQPSAAPLPSTDAVRHHAWPSLPAGLIILLAALSLAATGGAIAIVLVQRRRRRDGRGYAPVPAPRRPYDDQPAGPPSRMEELNGPRYR
jgi:Fibronectin type III domain